MSMNNVRARYWARRAIALLMLAVLFLMLAPPTAQAHTNDQSYLYLNVGEGLTVEVHMPFDDLREHLGFELDGNDDEMLAELNRKADVIVDYAIDHTEFSTPEGTWRLVDPEISRYREGEYVAVNFAAEGVPTQVPQEFTVTFDPFFQENPDRDALFIVANDVSRGIIGNEEDQFVRFTPDNPTQLIDLGDTSQWKNFTASLELGIDHIRTGPDHILFIAVLLLPSVLVFRNSRWYPGTGFRSSLWRIVKIVSMFTVAHSITFTIAGLGIVNIDDFTAVEAIIALSITAAAIHNLRPVLIEREWILAFGFGLFHGLGFASLVSNLEVGRGTQLISLLGRNVGIEIGQVIVVLVTFPALYLLRRTRYYRPFMIAASIALVVISLAWFGERVFDTSDWASLYTEEALRLPRAWVLLAIFTALCGAAQWYEGTKGRLLDLPPAEDNAADVSSSDHEKRQEALV